MNYCKPSIIKKKCGGWVGAQMMTMMMMMSVSAVSWCVKSGILTWLSLSPGYSSLSCRLCANQPSVSPATSHHPPATAGRWVRLRPSRWLTGDNCSEKSRQSQQSLSRNHQTFIHAQDPVCRRKDGCILIFTPEKIITITFLLSEINAWVIDLKNEFVKINYS